MLTEDIRPSVHLSVRLSHAGILWTPLNISSNFLLSGSPTILVFSIPSIVAIFQRGAPNGSVKCKGVWVWYKNDDFPPISRCLRNDAS